MNLTSLPDFLIEPFVRAALQEDLGRGGDLTSMALIPEETTWKGALVARDFGIVAGLDAARLSFSLFDPSVLFEPRFKEGQKIDRGDVIALVSGSARSLLGAERTALNFLCHLSGVATATRRLVEAAQPYKAKICCTRKTTPCLRTLEKYAVRAGGGSNHRMGLDDAILIKDNHIAVCGSLEKAVAAARQVAGHMVKIELEVDTLEQLEIALSLPLDAVLLDNMKPEILTRAVSMVSGRFVTEASGKVTPDNVAVIAATGVDIISTGWVTHSAPILDIGLDI